MIKKVSRLSIFLILLMGVISYGVGFINLSDKKQSVADGLKSSTGFDVEITGKVGVGLFPPSFILEEVKVLDAERKLVIEAKSMQLEVGAAIFASQFSIKSIKGVSLIEATINPYTTLAHLQGDGKSDGFTGINNIKLVNCIFISDDGYDDSFLSYDKIVNVDASIKYGSLIGGNNLNVRSSFFINAVKYDFNGDFDDVDINGNSSHSKINFSNKTFVIDFNGSLAKLFSVPELKGKIDAKIQDMQSVSYLVQDYPLLQPLLQTKQLGFSADFVANKQKAEIQNINISSKDITSVTGSVGMDFSHGGDFDIAFSVESVDVDAIMNEQSKNSGASNEVGIDLEKTVLKVISNFDFKISDKISATLDFTIKNIIVNKDKISDFHSSIDIFEGKALVNALEFKTPGQGVFNLNGMMDHNKVRPKLTSDLYIAISNLENFKSWLSLVDDASTAAPTSAKDPSGDNKFIMKTKLELIPNNITLSGIRAALNSTQFVGRVLVHNEDDAHLNFTAAIRMNKLDLDALSLNNKFDDYIYHLFVSDFDKTGEVFSHFTKDLRWLRAWNSPLQLEVIIDDLFFKQKPIKDFSIVFNLSRNQLAVSKITLNSDAFSVNGKFAVTVPMFRPYITGNMNFDLVDFNKVQNLFPDFATMGKAYRDYLNKKFSETPPKDEGEAQNRKNILEVAHYENNFLGANNYDADLDVRIGTLKTQKLTAEDAKFHLNITNGVCSFKEMSAKVMGGDLRLNANVTILTPITYFNSSFSLTNMSPAQLYTFVTGNSKVADGYVNVVGNLSSKGSSGDLLYKNIAGSMAVSAIRISWPGMDLSKVVEFSESTLEIPDKMKSIQYYTKYGNTLFDTVKGSIKVTDGIINLNDFTVQNSRVSGAFAARYSMFSKLFSSIEKYSFIPVGRNDRLILTLQSKGALNKPATEVNFDDIKAYFIKMRSNKTAQPSNEKADTIDSILRSRRG